MHDIKPLADNSGWNSIIEDFAKQLHEGNLSGKEIHEGLYFETADKLAKAVTEGLGSEFAYDDPGNSLSQRLRSNLYQFSGAKSLTESAAFSELLNDEKGKLKSFSQYRKDIKALHGEYNEQYLSAEYGNAIAQAQMAGIWVQYGDDDWLEFRTAGDERVREAHRKLDGIIQQKSSGFWKKYYPPLDWGCRCHVVPGEAPAKPLTESEASTQAKGSVSNEVFFNNAGESGIIFSEDHPYYQSTKGIRELDAVRNYGMRPVDRILNKANNLPARQHIDTETDYYAWWQKMVKDHGVNETDFVLKDKMGTKILFDASPDAKRKYEYFKDHILKKSEEARHEYATNLMDILKNPDEIWSKNNGKDYQYIKYYADGMYTVTALNDLEIVRAVTMYLVDDKNSMKTLRRGVLLHKR